MKPIFCILLFFAALAFPATAQRNFEPYNDTDVLTNQDTVTDLFPYLFKRPYYYSVQVQSDSVSGANAGTCTLEVSNENTPTKWSVLQTMTINDAGSDTALWEGIIYARRMRVRWITPSGTRVVNTTTNASFKAVNAP